METLEFISNHKSPPKEELSLEINFLLLKLKDREYEIETLNRRLEHANRIISTLTSPEGGESRLERLEANFDAKAWLRDNQAFSR